MTTQQVIAGTILTAGAATLAYHLPSYVRSCTIGKTQIGYSSIELREKLLPGFHLRAAGFEDFYVLDRDTHINGFDVLINNGAPTADVGIDQFDISRMHVVIVDEDAAIAAFKRDASPATCACMGQSHRYDGSPSSTIRFSQAGRLHKFFVERVEDRVRALPLPVETKDVEAVLTKTLERYGYALAEPPNIQKLSGLDANMFRSSPANYTSDVPRTCFDKRNM